MVHKRLSVLIHGSHQRFLSGSRWYLFQSNTFSGRGQSLYFLCTSRSDKATSQDICKKSRMITLRSTHTIIITTDILTFYHPLQQPHPISLIVAMEVVKFQQAAPIGSDLDMYYARTGTPAFCRTSSLVEELDQIEFIFSDKTGMLTRNEMEFKCASIGGVGMPRKWTRVGRPMLRGTGRVSRRVGRHSTICRG